MQLRFFLRIHHTNISGIDNAGTFVSEFEGSVLKSGVFHFLDDGEVAMSDVERLVETSHLTKGLRHRERQVRFVCVLKATAKDETADANDPENGDADAPYFCATIDKNGWKLIKTIIDKHNKHEVFSHV